MLVHHTSEWKGRATQGAAKALLGKVFLIQEKWQQAESKLAEVVALDYELLENYEDNFNGKGENGSEIILKFNLQLISPMVMTKDKYLTLKFPLMR